MRIWQLLKDWRSQERLAAKHPIRLVWRDKYGEGFVVGTCRDISNGGVGMECLEPVPLRARLTVNVDGRAASARICYRVKRGSAYIVGLQFIRRKNLAQVPRRNELELSTHE